MCVLHMCENYGHHATIIFYGYDSSNLTKGVEQRRAAQAITGNFLFDLDQLRQTHQRRSFFFNKQWKQIYTDIMVYDWASQVRN